MSLLIIPNSGKRIHLIYQTQYGQTPNFSIKLFQNNVTVSSITVLADLVEATFSGYSSPLLSGQVIEESLDGFSRAVSVWNPATWTKSGASANTIYGYYVCLPGPALMWVEKFDTPIPMTTDGAYLVITPRLTFTSQY